MKKKIETIMEKVNILVLICGGILITVMVYYIVLMIMDAIDMY